MWQLRPTHETGQITGAREDLLRRAAEQQHQIGGLHAGGGAEGFVTATLSSTPGEPNAPRHAAATASCHCAVASARKIRSVDREMRCR